MSSLAGSVVEAVCRRIERNGPVPFSVVMDEALYGPAGFYAVGGGAGRRRDFITSPEVGALFGSVLATFLDERWTALGRPDPYLVVEVGAGPGMLARTILAAAPRCGGSLRYLMVERSAAMRAVHGAHLALTPADEIMGAMQGGADDPSDRQPVPGQGPLVASMAEVPAQRFRGVILANELLDNLAFDLLERQADGWAEVRADDGGDHLADGLREVLVSATAELSQWADELAPDAPVGARIPHQAAARGWVHDARTTLEAGTVLVIDYCVDTTASLAVRPWPDWLRTYRAHGRGRHPFQDLGLQDITADVAIDQLPLPTRIRTQGEALRHWGMDRLVSEARSTWHERAAVGDLAALTARSRVHEADALADPTGLGAFSVLEWDIGRLRLS